jgi:ATP/maltotriose-dependent transcriptional regulator MalT
MQWLEKAIAAFRAQVTAMAEEDTREAQLLAKALVGAGILAIYQNQYQQAMALLQECLAISRKLDDKARIALALHGIARMIMRIGQFKEAESLYTESIALFRDVNNQWGIAQALLYRGLSLWAEGKFAQAPAPLEEALAVSRQIDDPQGINQSLEALAWAELGLGKLPQAHRLLEAAVAMARTREDRLLLTRGLHGLGAVLRLQDADTAAQSALAESFLIAFELGDRWHIVGCLLEIAQLALKHGQVQRAARILGACESLLPNIKSAAPAFSAALHVDLTTRLQARLGARLYADALAEGAQRAALNALADWEQLISEPTTAEPDTGKPASTTGSTPLTEREQEVLHLLAQGLTNAQIAERLTLSPFTINAHLRNIYNKLDVPSRPAAIRYALEHQLA